jgi:hypothetical protein
MTITIRYPWLDSNEWVPSQASASFFRFNRRRCRRQICRPPLHPQRRRHPNDPSLRRQRIHRRNAVRRARRQHLRQPGVDVTKLFSFITDDEAQ